MKFECIKKTYCHILIHKCSVYKRIWNLCIIYIFNLSLPFLFERKKESRERGRAHEGKVQWVRVPEYPRQVLRQSWHTGRNRKVHEQQNRERYQNRGVNDHRPANEAKHKQQHAARIHGAALAWWNAGTEKATEGPRVYLCRQSLSFSRCHKNNAISSSFPLFCGGGGAMTSPLSSPPRPSRREPHSISAETQPAPEHPPLLPSRLHRLESIKICIIYSHRALRTNGYHHTHLINLYTKPWQDHNYFGPAADIFPAYPNANMRKSRNCLRPMHKVYLNA